MTHPSPAPAPPDWTYCGHGADPMDDPVGCRGIHITGHAACLAHVDETARDTYLAALSAGANVDHRGTPFTEDLLNRLLNRLHDPTTGFARLGHARFSEATFTHASFGEASFTDDASFAGATFTGNTWFGGATFTHASFGEASFTGTAQFDGATFTSDALFVQATFTDDAKFAEVAFAG